MNPNNDKYQLENEEARLRGEHFNNLNQQRAALAAQNAQN